MAPPGTRGPRRGLTLEQIVDAAVEVADAEGASALSMGRVAKQLGYTTMSLYRYVDSKDTLIQLVTDRVIGPAPQIDPALGWRDALFAWGMAEFESIMKHPWWLDIPLGAPPTGPNNMAWLEAGLAAIAPSGLPESLKFQLVMNVSFYVIGRTRLVREFSASDPDADADFGRIMTQVLDPAQFPAITRALAAQTFDADDPEWEVSDFAFGFERLLDGYERFVESFDG
ncbi:TetR/AcrR family transcriptional regulator [Aldersonia kunmingensis]|uniref:TetR/AcrR family transcriptional regulator n=1 Tax=Aldersonia kunmingensis TaxID=408066 RepID=UPI0012EE6434|nr:TetR/AcrR family transcriptional regulator [Aldersonia kunmingensis]